MKKRRDASSKSDIRRSQAGLAGFFCVGPYFAAARQQVGDALHLRHNISGPKKELSLGEVYGHILDASSSYWAAYLSFFKLSLSLFGLLSSLRRWG